MLIHILPQASNLEKAISDDLCILRKDNFIIMLKALYHFFR